MREKSVLWIYLLLLSNKIRSSYIKRCFITVYPGQQLALEGYSGSGKNTIIQLLTRLYDVEDGKGEILIIVISLIIIMIITIII